MALIDMKEFVKKGGVLLIVVTGIFFGIFYVSPEDDYGSALFLRGSGPDSLEASIKLTRKAAMRGHPAAQHDMGALYEIGQGVPRDHLQAWKWYREAAKKNFIPNSNNLQSGTLWQNARSEKDPDPTYMNEAAAVGTWTSMRPAPDLTLVNPPLNWERLVVREDGSCETQRARTTAKDWGASFPCTWEVTSGIQQGSRKRWFSIDIMTPEMKGTKNNDLLIFLDSAHLEKRIRQYQPYATAGQMEKKDAFPFAR